MTMLGLQPFNYPSIVKESGGMVPDEFNHPWKQNL